MASDEPRDGRCGIEVRNGDGYCENYPVDGASTCRVHGGTGGAPEGNSNAEGDGAPENNANAETHGGYADAEKWFERHREECNDEVRSTVAEWVKKANFDWSNHGNIKLLVEAAINEQQIGNLNDYIREHGEIVETVVDTDEAGRPVTTKEENPAFLAKSRLSKDTVRILNKFGILDSPEKQQAEAQESLATLLSEGD